MTKSTVTINQSGLKIKQEKHGSFGEEGRATGDARITSN